MGLFIVGSILSLIFSLDWEQSITTARDISTVYILVCLPRTKYKQTYKHALYRCCVLTYSTISHISDRMEMD